MTMEVEPKLRDFLKKCRVEPGSLFTHTSKGVKDADSDPSKRWPAGNYFIPAEQRKNFYVMYCNALAKKCAMTLTEKPMAYCPLRVDFDFKASIDVGTKRQYDAKMIQKIVGFYQDEIRKIVESDDGEIDEKMLRCVVLEKAAPRVEDGEIKDGFHLHFPFFICDGWVQDAYLREKVTNRMIETKIWRNAKLKTPIDKLIDTPMATKVWMMYGSMNWKNKKSTPYLCQPGTCGYVLDENLEEMALKDLFADEMEKRRRDAKKKEAETGKPVNVQKVEYYLPMLMSIQGYQRPCPLIQEIQERAKKYSFLKSRKPVKVKPNRSEAEIAADLKLIRDELINMLSDERADDKKDWRQVGLVLYGIGCGKDEALDIWIDFSKRSNKFKEGECATIWDRDFKPNNSTIGSIYKFARLDSPDKYKEWKDLDVKTQIHESLKEAKPNEYEACKVACKLYKGRFLCSDADKDHWYEFSNHKYRQMQDCNEFKKVLVEDLVSMYADVKNELTVRIGTEEHHLDVNDDEEDNKNAQGELKFLLIKKKRCTAMITALKTCGFLDKVIRMCKLYMTDRDFYRKRDENKLIFGCENGVLDMQTMTFRDGLPDDYRTYSCGINYTVFREDDDEVKKLDKYLEMVYPNPNLRNYFLDFFATCLQGGNENKRVLFMIGGRDGAKSMTTSLLGLVFGTEEDGYFGKFPRELLVQATGKSNSAGARPELAQVRGKRLMGAQELTAFEKLNVGFIKEASGNDKFYTRNLYEKGSTINPQHTIVVQLNEGPTAEGEDDAFWSRIRLLDHESKFVKPQDLKDFPVPDTWEEQLSQKTFLADPSFAKDLEELAEPLLWRLFERLKAYKQGGSKLYEPSEVIDSTNSYKAENDKYQRFLNEKLKLVKNPEKAAQTSHKVTDLLVEFNSFVKEEYPYIKEKITKDAFKKGMRVKIGIIGKKDKIRGLDDKKGIIYGYKLRIDEKPGKVGGGAAVFTKGAEDDEHTLEG